MKKIHKVAMECVSTMIKKGYSEKKATDMVLEILNESFNKGSYEIGGSSMVIATLRMVFMDEDTSTDTKGILTNILK